MDASVNERLARYAQAVHRPAPRFAAAVNSAPNGWRAASS
jgi:hypothetical protein